MNKPKDVDAASDQPIIHTPGPGEPVRSVTCGHLRAEHNYFSDPKKEWTDADMRLIAAAPKMLACMKRLQVAIGEFCCLNCITEEDLESEGLDLLEASKEVDRIIADIEVV